MLPSKQQRPQSGQSRSGTPTDQQVEWRPRHWSAVRGVAAGHEVAEAGGCLGALLLACDQQVCTVQCVVRCQVSGLKIGSYKLQAAVQHLYTRQLPGSRKLGSLPT